VTLPAYTFGVTHLVRIRLLFTVLMACVLLGAFAKESRAFCRTTTCRCRSDAPLPTAHNGLPQSTCGLPNGDCPRDEHGCRTTGTPIAWTSRCVGYSAALAGTSVLTTDEWNDAFQTSFHAWQLVDCGGGKHPSIELYTLRPTTCGKSEYNSTGPNVNAIYFTDNGWGGPQTDDNLDGVLALTKTHFAPSGAILDADIAINSARHDFTVSDDLKARHQDLVSVLTHEVGHFLGVDHSDDPSAVMFWSYKPGSVRRDLQDDDIKAVCTIYPPAQTSTCDPTPRGGLQDSCGEKPSVGCALAAPESTAGSMVPMVLGALGLMVARGRARRGRKR